MATYKRKPWMVVSGGKTQPPYAGDDPEADPPTVTSISPTRWARSDGPIVITFTGTGFELGMELEVHRADDTVIHYPFNSVSSQSATILLDFSNFPEPEVISLRVENFGNVMSNARTFRVT